MASVLFVKKAFQLDKSYRTSFTSMLFWREILLTMGAVELSWNECDLLPSVLRSYGPPSSP